MPFLKVAGRSLAYAWIRRRRNSRAVLVFLHEGLGSIGQWRDFPAKLAAATGCHALVYDRYGHGRSDVLAEPRRAVRFMHDEGLVSLPALLDRLAVRNPILVGHSDGASIALIHAGAGHAVRGVVAMAPHVFIEDRCLSAIEEAAQRFESTDLAARLARRHRDARRTFYGWADVWLDPEFRRWDIRADYLGGVRCPVLAIQGYDDAYGTMAQLEELRRCAWGPCTLVRLRDCSHHPFREQPGKVLLGVSAFIRELLS